MFVYSRWRWVQKCTYVLVQGPLVLPDNFFAKLFVIKLHENRSVLLHAFKQTERYGDTLRVD